MVEPERPDIFKPADLVKFNSRLSIGYNRESTINDKKTKLNSNTKNLFALSSFDPPYLDRSSFSFLINNFISNNYFDDKSDVLEINQNITDETFAISVNPNQSLLLGAGVEHNSGHTHGFYQVEINALRYLSFGFRQFSRTLRMNSLLNSDGHSALFQLAGTENVRELDFALDHSPIYRFQLAFELDQPKNLNVGLNLFPLSRLSIDYQYSGLKYEYFNTISIDGNAGGTIISKFTKSAHQLLLRYRQNSQRQFFVNARRVVAQPGIAGNIDAQYVLNFWQDLLFGERDYNAHYTIKINQFNLGMENIISKHFTFRGGIQYIHLTPSGELIHWTPSPVIGVGQFDTKVIPVPYKNASFSGLSFGITYRIKKIELTYGISQLIPIRIEKTEGSVATPASHGHIDLDNLWKELQKDHGGNMQQLELTWYF